MSTSTVSEVVAFVSEDLVQRGVKLAFQAGAQRIVADERDDSARLDPTYGHNELLASDAWWTVNLARDLAVWLHVGFRDEAFGQASPDAAIVATTQLMVDDLAGKPHDGAFDYVDIPFVTGGVRGALRLAPMPSGAGRYLELRVTTASGESTTGQWVTQGTNAELTAYLRAPETPAAIEKLIPDLVESQARHNFR